MNDSPSYIELCIRALPHEKQAAARAAFKDILEGAPDDSMLSRLLIVLEATAAYGKTIPHEISALLTQARTEMDTRLAKIVRASGADDERRLKQLHDLLEKQLPAMAEKLSLEKHTEAIDGTRMAVERLERSVGRLRHVRLGSALAITVFACALGAGGTLAYFKKDYEDGQKAVRLRDWLERRGVTTCVPASDSETFVLRIEGPTVRTGTVWLRDSQGRTTGVQLVYPQP